MPVTIEIVAHCELSASDLDFGPYTSNSTTPVLGQTVIQLLCSPGQTGELLLDAGTGGRGNKTSRRAMLHAAGNDRLDYGLYQDPARAVHWGDTPGTDTRELITTGSTQIINVYGQIPAGQKVRDGSYSDTITVLLQF